MLVYFQKPVRSLIEEKKSRGQMCTAFHTEAKQWSSDSGIRTLSLGDSCYLGDVSNIRISASLKEQQQSLAQSTNKVVNRLSSRKRK